MSDAQGRSVALELTPHGGELARRLNGRDLAIHDGGDVRLAQLSVVEAHVVDDPDEEEHVRIEFVGAGSDEEVLLGIDAVRGVALYNELTVVVELLG